MVLENELPNSKRLHMCYHSSWSAIWPSTTDCNITDPEGLLAEEIGWVFTGKPNQEEQVPCTNLRLYHLYYSQTATHALAFDAVTRDKELAKPGVQYLTDYLVWTYE